MSDKFRVWFPSASTMTEPLPMPPMSEDDAKIDWRKTPVYMQYTGIKDKDGVEVCEGDILGFEDRPCLFTVAFQNGTYSFNVITPNGASIETGVSFLQCYLSKEKMSILGNIYQNPGLMEKGEILYRQFLDGYAPIKNFPSGLSKKAEMRSISVHDAFKIRNELLTILASLSRDEKVEDYKKVIKNKINHLISILNNTLEAIHTA